MYIVIETFLNTSTANYGFNLVSTGVIEGNKLFNEYDLKFIHSVYLVMISVCFLDQILKLIKLIEFYLEASLVSLKPSVKKIIAANTKIFANFWVFFFIFGGKEGLFENLNSGIDRAHLVLSGTNTQASSFEKYSNPELRYPTCLFKNDCQQPQWNWK